MSKRPDVQAAYTLTFDHRQNLLVITATGFWDRALQDRFGDELIARMRALRDSGRAFRVLADARELPVQSIPISLGFMGIVKRIDRDLLVPTAVVTTSMLVKLQALRVFVAPHIRMFGDVDSATDWLAGTARDVA